MKKRTLNLIIIPISGAYDINLGNIIYIVGKHTTLKMML